MQKMDYSRLLGRIKEFGMTQRKVASAIGVSESHFSQKISGKYAFTQAEVYSICNLLEIPTDSIGSYFFTVLVEKTQHPHFKEVNTHE